jgi:ABC-type antimicrobial peptide transport system permease subunit
MITFGALALVLAGIGIYGVMSQLVESRVQEIGVRVALGAKPAHVLSQFLVGCAYQTSAGIVIGATAGVTAMSTTQLLFGIRPWDAPTLVIVVATIMAASMSACLVPAWRALRIDPVTAIRG